MASGVWSQDERRLQRFRNEGCQTSPQSLLRGIEGSGSFTGDRQYNCDGLCESARGDEVPGPHAGSEECISSGRGSGHDTHSQICGGSSKLVGRQLVQEGPSSEERMVSQPGDIPMDLSHTRRAVGGSVCHTLEQEASPVHIPDHGPSGVSCRHAEFFYPWKGIWVYAYPPT